MIASKEKDTFNYIAEKKIGLQQQPECAWSLHVGKFPVKNLVCQGDSRHLEIRQQANQLWLLPITLHYSKVVSS